MKRLFILIILGLSLFSCTKVVEFNGTESEPLLVVNSIINPDSLVEVFVTKSWFFLDERSSDTIKDATVKLFNGNTEVARLNYASDGRYRSENFKPAPNTTYRVEVEAEGFNAAAAEATFPEGIPINELDTITYFDDYGYINDLEVGITFTDPANEKNYYRIDAFFEAWRWDEYAQSYYYYRDGLWLSSDDPVITGIENENELWGGSYNQFNIFDDTYFEGNTYTLKMITYPWDLMKQHENDHFRFTFKLVSISEEFYNYLKSRTLHSDNEENPFVEPVPVYSNVTNGIGFFGGYSAASYSFDHDGYNDPWRK